MGMLPAFYEVEQVIHDMGFEKGVSPECSFGLQDRISEYLVLNLRTQVSK